MNDFSKATLRALARKGVSLIGLHALPDMSSPMPYANAQRGYVLNDNGCGRVMSHSQVLDLAQ